MSTPPIDLYEDFDLDRGATCEELMSLIVSHDAALGNEGVPHTDFRRRRWETAYAVLSRESTRSTYDDALAAGRALTWAELDHLAVFGALSDAEFGGVPSREVPSPQYAGRFQLLRAPVGLRLAMLIVDSLLGILVVGVASLPFMFDGFLAAFVAVVATLAYFIGLESWLGGTPAKHLFGYQVRDLQTGAKPTLLQATKRNWWRLIGCLIGPGTFVSAIILVILSTSISPHTQYLGSHDRWAGLEVARKS